MILESVERDLDRRRYVMSVGGSLIVPQKDPILLLFPTGTVEIQPKEEPDVKFLREFRDFIKGKIISDPKKQFFLVAGGGATARTYINAAQEVVGHSITDDDKDWLGIHSSRLNAHLLRTIFRDEADPRVIKHYEVILKILNHQIATAAGWQPGWSTDFCATILCQDYGVDKLINLSNIDQVCDKDPKKYPDAKPLSELVWSDYREQAGDTWSPGMNLPFDPIASKLAERMKLTVAILNGHNLPNLDNYLEGRPFVGTIIHP